ncbi:MAG TPA: hypothetical protein VIY48_20765 [Candidatus Paceibacterota bacterium]
MPGNETVYNVRVKYALDAAQANSSLKGMATQADKTGESVFSLKHLVEGLALHEVFKLGKEALVDFNNEMTNLKIGLATVMNMNLHMPLAKANKEADKLFNTFQDLAKKSPLTTKDFAEMATAISPAIAMAGGGPDKLAKITAGALTAGLAYGSRADITAMDVQEMMMGNVTKRNRLGNELLGSIGMDHEEFNKKDAKTRAQLVEKMFDQQGLKDAADRFGQTFKGQTSTLKDNLQIALGEVGKPLMEAMTAEVSKWNKWIEKHPKLIAETGERLAGMIKGAFEFVRDAGSWLVDNRETLFEIGKIFLVFKGAQIGTSVFKSFADGIGKLADGAKTASMTLVSMFQGGSAGSITGAFGGLVGILKGAGGVIPALSLFVGGLSLATTLLNTHSELDKKARAAKTSIHEAVGDFPGLMERRKFLEDTLAGKGTYGAALKDSPEMRERYSTELEGVKSKMFDSEKMGEALKKISEASEQNGGIGFKNLTLADMQHAERFMPNLYAHGEAASNNKVAEEMLSTLKLFENMTLDARREALKYAFPEQWGSPTTQKPATPDGGWTGGEKPNINVTIQRIEVASEDPDRFVFGLAKVAEQAVKHKTQSSHTIAGGF